MSIKEWHEYDFEAYKDPMMIRATCDTAPPIVFAVSGTPCQPSLIRRFVNSDVCAEDTYELVERIQQCLKVCSGLTLEELRGMAAGSAR